MSALAGIWRLDEEPDARKSCARMLSAQRIYGPHAVACWNGGFVAMGRALFRLVHEDRFDRQPLIGEVGQLVLVADLRLDNRDELADALEIDRDRRRTLCDAAILLAAYDRWSEACLDRILGDYAFALYDARRRRLLLARDPLGQRPLHYHCGRNLFAFASMPKGLHALPGIPREVDEERVAEFLVLLPESGPRTFYREIARVEPGHLLAFDGSGISSRRYWEPKRVTLVLKHPRDYVEGLREQVDRATRARLRGAEAAVGAHLSAGLDSSIVAGTAARQLAAAGGRVIAFTGAPREGYAADPRETRIADESGHAAVTAAMHANVDHVVVRAGPISPLQDIDRYPFLFDQPLLNLCNTGWIARHQCRGARARAERDAERDHGQLHPQLSRHAISPRSAAERAVATLVAGGLPSCAQRRLQLAGHLGFESRSLSCRPRFGSGCTAPFAATAAT